MLGVLGLIGPGPIYAAKAPAGENITASPTQIQPELDAGATTQGNITIINDGTKAFDFKGYTTPYHVAGEDYDPSFTTRAQGASDPSAWIHLPSQVFHSELRQTIVIPYTIAVPAGTGGGGYYATLFFETLPKPGPATGVTSKQRVGIVAYIRVKGSIVERGSVRSFTMRLIQPGPPVTSALRLQNSGNVHYGADITQRITDLFGHPKATIHVIRQVLPGTVRRFVLAWDKAPSFGLFRADTSVTMLGRTETLPTKYVLVLSAGAFVAMAAALLLLVVVVVWWWPGRRRR
ncbi:MAG: exported protein of unknown function [Patescibacteria group bacterium]|nr:exported protein of unknown function [Patescibacteria group bacterium]